MCWGGSIMRSNENDDNNTLSESTPPLFQPTAFLQPSSLVCSLRMFWVNMVFEYMWTVWHPAIHAICVHDSGAPFLSNPHSSVADACATMTMIGVEVPTAQEKLRIRHPKITARRSYIFGDIWTDGRTEMLLMGWGQWRKYRRYLFAVDLLKRRLRLYFSRTFSPKSGISGVRVYTRNRLRLVIMFFLFGA